ncbi:unnamed protein product [Penicillium pancosmium]
MNYGYSQRNPPSGTSLHLGSSSADYASEEHLEDTSFSSLITLLHKFPYYSCDIVVESCIQMLGSDWHWKDEQPKWWPPGVRYMGTKKLRKSEKIELIRALLCGQLLNIATVQEFGQIMEHATIHIESTERPLIISRILEGFRTLKATQRQGNDASDSHLVNETQEISDLNLSSCDEFQGFLQPSPITPPVLQIWAINPSYPEFLVDLNQAICIEWQSYSGRGDPLTPATLTWVEFQGGGLNPLDHLLPPLLQNSTIVQNIQDTGRLGVLNLVIVHEKVPGHFVMERSYMAFSIRIAVSQPGMPHIDVPAHGWEYVSSTVAQFEASCLFQGA